MGRKKKPTPKTRRAKGTGSVLPDARRGGWLAKIPIGRYANGRTKYTEVRAGTQAEVVAAMKTIAPPDPSAVTVAEWADRWLATTGAQPQTADDYAHTVKRFIKPTLGTKRLAELTAADVENAVRSWPLGANTARKNLRQVVTMLEAARRAKLVVENVAMDARGPKARKVPVMIFTAGELVRIVAAACLRAEDSIFALLASVGCRGGEALALDISDYDPATGKLSITKTYSRKHGSRRPKSENGIRTVTVPAFARPAMAKATGLRKTGPLFTAAHGKGRRQHNTVRSNWKVFLRDLGLTYRRPHTLRHAVATHSLAAGVHVANVARDLGDSVQTIVKTYCHATAGPSVSDAMDKLFSGGNPTSERA